MKEETIQCSNGVKLKSGDIFDIHQTVNGASKFLVKSISPLDIRYYHVDGVAYEYDKYDLLTVDELEVIGNIHADKLHIITEMFDKCDGEIFRTDIFLVCDYFERYAISSQIEVIQEIDPTNEKIIILQQQLQKLKDGK